MITNFTRQNGGGAPTVSSVNGQTGTANLASVDIPLTTLLALVPGAVDVDAALQGLAALIAAGDPRLQSAAAAPATRGDGAPLQEGDLWFDAANDALKAYDGSAWVDVGLGDVAGAASSADNAVVRFDGATGKLIQASGVFIDDLGQVGIGTATPASALDIIGTISQTAAATTGVMDLQLSSRFNSTIAANTTFSFANVPAGRAAEVVLQITDGGGHAVTWPASVTWAGGSPPTLKASGTDVVSFWTQDGGISWQAHVQGPTAATPDPRLLASATAPTARADASALQDGDLWYDTTVDQLKVREAGAWVGVGGAVSVASSAFDPATGNLILTMSDASTVTTAINGRFVQTVNAIVPDALGNVPVALTAVETGTDAVRTALTPTNGTVFVVSGDPDPNANGKTYIWEAGTAAWYQVVGYDTPAMDARYVNQSGDTMTGALTLHADPTTALQAATKQYVDLKSDWIGFPLA